MHIAVGSDHAGLGLKKILSDHLVGLGFHVEDLGTTKPESCDYPDYAKSVGEAVSLGRADWGLLVCGTGVGMAMAANKVRGVRAAVVSDTFCASATRQHNNANVLCLGERVVGVGVAVNIVNAWLSAEFEGGRHQRRIDKITVMEETL